MSHILNECESIFHGIGKMKDEKVKIVIDESITPVPQKKYRRVPLHLLDKVDNELKHIFDAWILEPVNDASEWVSRVVIVPKRN